MLDKSQYKLSYFEKFFRHFWVYFIWIKWVTVASFLFYTSRSLDITQLLTHNDTELLGRNFAHTLIFGLMSVIVTHFCTYSRNGLWVLRYIFYSRFISLAFLVQAVFTLVPAFTYYKKIGQFYNPIVIGLIILTAFSLILIEFFASLKMISINKKMNIQKLSNQEIEGLNQLAKDYQNDQLYKDLTFNIPKMSWLINRIKNQEARLVTKW